MKRFEPSRVKLTISASSSLHLKLDDVARRESITETALWFPSVCTYYHWTSPLIGAVREAQEMLLDVVSTSRFFSIDFMSYLLLSNSIKTIHRTLEISAS